MPIRLSVNSEADGKFTQIEVDPTETVANVKARLEAELGVPALQQLLLHNGKVLQDGAVTLATAGVGADDMITLRRGQAMLSADDPIPTNLRMSDVRGDAPPELLIRIFQVRVPLSFRARGLPSPSPPLPNNTARVAAVPTPSDAQ